MNNTTIIILYILYMENIWKCVVCTARRRTTFNPSRPWGSFSNQASICETRTERFGSSYFRAVRGGVRWTRVEKEAGGARGRRG